MRLRPALLAAVLAAIGISMAWAPAALATHVSCGDTITTDTALDSDLTNCPGNGVVIGADGITLDLRGHTIDGPDGNDPFFGVDNTAGHDGVVVRNGEIRDFFQPVRLENADRNLLEDLTGTGSFQLVDSSDNVIQRNSGAFQVFLQEDSDRNLIVRNSIVDGGDIRLGGPFPTGPMQDDNVIERNVSTGLFVGVSLSGSAFRTRVERNDVTATSELASPMVIAGSRSFVANNRVRGGEFGIFLGGFVDSTTLLRNDVSGALLDGIAIVNSSNTLLDGNSSVDNGDDGIDVGPSCPQPHCTPPTGVTLTKNTGDYNVDLGIEADPGVTDGGGNKAKGNGNQLQCVGVVCK